MGFKAIVMGGSIAGLLTGRMLSDHFEEVTIIERDTYPTSPQEMRKGVPQAHHTHSLLLQGYTILETLFPNIEQELEQYGAPRIRWGDEALIMPLARQFAQFPSKPVVTCTRTLLEWQIVQRLKTNPKIKIQVGTVKNLLLEDQMVKGVMLEDGQKITADFVVDASGRHSKTPDWLAQAGYELVQATEVDSQVGYASAIFEPPTTYNLKWKSVLFSSGAVDNPRGGIIYPIENGLWQVTLTGIGRAFHPPDDMEGFKNFAKQVDLPCLGEALAEAKPLSPIYKFTRTANLWHHYEKLTKMPGRFVVLGDAACAFNPVYAQGMTVAAMNVMALHKLLSQSSTAFTQPDFGLKFQREIARLDGFAWQLATSDVREGMIRPLSTKEKIAGWYKDAVFNASQYNSEVARIFFEVLHLVRPPSHLFHPRIVASVTKQTLRPS
jgi:2-polyprenyl-6-methoxyphenol hydroxylase-like FAD-dependent oxidoreductase